MKRKNVIGALCLFVLFSAGYLFLRTSPVFRLVADGTPDSTFNPTLDYVNNLRSITIQRDGKLLVGGTIAVGGIFNKYGGVEQQNLLRLKPKLNRAPAFDFDSDGKADCSWRMSDYSKTF